MEKYNGVAFATIQVVEALKGKLRKADYDECWAAGRESADDAMEKGFNRSTYTWAGFVDGEPFCIFGVAPFGLLGVIGIPWMMATDRMTDFDAAKITLKNSKPYIKEMMERYDYLENWVDARNTVAIRWLKWCGFEFSKEPHPYGVMGEKFYKFWMNKEA